MGYIDEARRRAGRRKSPWNLLIFALWFPATLTLCVLAVRLGWQVHLLAYPAHAPYWDALMTEKHTDLWRWAAGMLVMFGPAVPNLIVGALFANVVVRSIPPARAVLDSEATAQPGTDFVSAQRSLVRYLPIAAIAGYAAWLVGSLLPYRLP